MSRLRSVLSTPWPALAALVAMTVYWSVDGPARDVVSWALVLAVLAGGALAEGRAAGLPSTALRGWTPWIVGAALGAWIVVHSIWTHVSDVVGIAAVGVLVVLAVEVRRMVVRRSPPPLRRD